MPEIAAHELRSFSFVLASELMRRNPVTVTPTTSFIEVQRLCVTAQISHIPVVDLSGRVYGVVTGIDLLCAIDQALDDEYDDSANQETMAEDIERLAQLTAADIVSPEVTWVLPSASIEDVAVKMLAGSVHSVLVGTDRHLEGILTTFDLLRAIRGDFSPNYRVGGSPSPALDYDCVEQASIDSFPASDPPGWVSSHAVTEFPPKSPAKNT